jgi:hypothetical protein
MADGFEVAVVGMIIEQLADVELAYPTFTAVVGLDARRPVGDLRPVATRPGHGTPEQTRAVEWEHRAG